MPPLTLTASNTTISVISGDLVAAALIEINVLAQGETPTQADSLDGLENLQRRIDLVNAQMPLIYAVNFSLFTLGTNKQPLTIGPGGDFVTAFVPVDIPSWSLVLSNGVEIPGGMLGDSDWAKVAIKNLTSTLCTSLYYSRGPALGSLFFWPIPTQANQVRLQLWSNVSQALDLTTALAMPPAYWAYLLCSLASDLAPRYGPNAVAIVSSETFMRKYREARNAITANNMGAPALSSDVPKAKRGSVIPDFNFLSGYRG